MKSRERRYHNNNKALKELFKPRDRYVYYSSSILNIEPWEQQMMDVWERTAREAGVIMMNNTDEVTRVNIREGTYRMSSTQWITIPNNDDQERT